MIKQLINDTYGSHNKLVNVKKFAYWIKYKIPEQVWNTVMNTIYSHGKKEDAIYEIMDRVYMACIDKHNYYL